MHTKKKWNDMSIIWKSMAGDRAKCNDSESILCHILFSTTTITILRNTTDIPAKFLTFVCSFLSSLLIDDWKDYSLCLTHILFLFQKREHHFQFNTLSLWMNNVALCNASMHMPRMRIEMALSLFTVHSSFTYSRHRAKGSSVMSSTLMCCCGQLPYAHHIINPPYF